MTTFALVFPAAHRRGGIERVVWETARYLAPRHATTFVGNEFAPMLPDHALALRRVSADGGVTSPVRFRRAATRILRDATFDVTISYGVNCPVGDVLSVGSVHRAWLDRGRAVRLHGMPVPNIARRMLPRHQVLLRLEHSYFTSTRSTSVLALTEQVAADLRAYYDVPDHKIHVIPNGYSADEFSSTRTAEAREPMRHALGLDDDHIAILLVANELHRKGLGTLLDALGRLDHPRLSLHIVGRMPLDAFRNKVSQLGLTDRVHWHGPSDEVWKYMAAADLFVLPTQYEPFGLVIVEALATGLPVITTALAGAAPAVRPGINGLLQDDPLDDLELAKLISQALETGTLDRWRAAAPASVVHYEWTSLLQRVEQVASGS